MGDGVTDDTKSLQDALDYCSTNNYIATFSKNALITDTIITDAFLYMPNGIITADVDNKTAFQYGKLNKYTSSKETYFPKIMAVSNLWNNNTVGIKVYNVKESRLYFKDIRNFTTGLELVSNNGLSVVYNDLFIGNLSNNKTNLYIHQEDSTSWINENNFIGGRYSHDKANGVDVEGIYQIVTYTPTDNPHLINNNLFIKPSLEGDTPKVSMRIQGVYNTFFNARYEKNQGNNIAVEFYSDSSNKLTQYNILQGGYHVANVNIIEDNYSNKNQLYSPLRNRISTSSSTGAYRLQNMSSDNYPLLRIVSNQKNIDDTTDSNYTASLSANSLDMKRTTDLFPRLKFDFVRGGLVGGDGTAIPTNLMQPTKTAFAFDSEIAIKNHAWNYNVLQLGNKIIWVDSNSNIRIKTGRPVSEFDGVIVNSTNSTVSNSTETSSNVHTVLSEYKRNTTEITDNARIQRAIDGTPEGSTLFIPISESPIVLDDTLTITKNVNLKSEAKIVYRGTRDRPVIVFKGQQYTSIDIRGIYDTDSYPVYGGANSYHGWKNNNYIGIVFNNLKNVKINIGELIGFTVGQKHIASEGKGHWFNTVNVDFHINNKESIELNSDGENSWMNSNKFVNSAFSYSGTPFISTTENLYCVKQTLTNGNTYGGNSNTFENFKFETRNPSPSNWTMVYLSKAVGFVFRNYRFEFNSPATFAEIDLRTQDSSKSYVTHSSDNLFYPEFILGTGHNIKFTNIGDIRLPRSKVAKIIEPSSKTYTLYSYDDLSKNYRYIGNNYHTIKGIYHKPIASTKWNEEVTYDYSTLDNLIDSKGLTTITSSFPMVIYLSNLTEGDEFSINKLSLQGTSSGIFIKCFDDNNNIIGKTDNNTNSLAMYGTYNESNNAWTFNNSSSSLFTINSPNVKKVAILISGTMNGVNIVTNSSLNAVAKGSSNMVNNKKNAFFSHIIPTSNRDFMYEDIVYNTNTTTGQPYGWKLTDGTWTSIGTIK